MRALFTSAMAALLLTMGCRNAASPAPTEQAAISPSPSSQPASVAPAAEEPADAEEGHEHVAPHGGTLVELGEEFAHVELVLDQATGTLTAYTLDGEAEQAVRLAQGSLEVDIAPPTGTLTTATLKGVANPLTGETDEDTSQFRAVVPGLKGATQFDGLLKAVSVRGQQFRDVSFNYPSDGHR